ncbi:MAG TPA: allantoinase AllB [Pseudonocardiaceae bacterium]|jgi:allantoinase|nr:allantoinase AllB [Pseudonocardiaceae bacterium]
MSRDRFDTAFRARRVITPQGERAACVGVRDGRIATVAPFDSPVDAARLIELAADEVLLPGLVDSHVHVNDPGRADWEGFDTATSAAAAGGITTIVDMPLNSVPATVDADALAVKRATARGRAHVDVGFWGGAVPANLDRMPELHDAGVFGFKCFLPPSGVEEFGCLDYDRLADVMKTVAHLDALLIVHAEDPSALDQAPPPHGRRYQDFLVSRPPWAEHTAINRVLELAQRFDARVHILHLSSAEMPHTLQYFTDRGVRATVETCPHYLTFCAEEIPDGATQFKCCPPIREAANRERLWRALADGVIDCVVSDHSPCTADLKRFDTGDFAAAWGGIAGLQVSLPAVWTGARQRGLGLSDVVRWMAQRPADLVGLHRKGRIVPGADADFCVFAPDDAFVVDAAALRHRNPISAFHGRPLAGVVRGTWLRGTEVTGDQPRGELLTRGVS